MITFYQLGELGRLGNQLFQYAALRALSLERGYDIKIPNPANREWHGQQCLLGSLNIEAAYLTDEDIKSIKHIYQEPDYMRFDSRFYQVPDNTNLSGFFQSTHYFKGHEDQIKKELRPNQHILEEAQQKLDTIKSQYPGYEIVSLHLRRGDNTDQTDPLQKELNSCYGGATLSEDSFYYAYWKKAQKVFENRKVKFLIFTGGKRGEDDNSKDIAWCKKNFGGEEFLFAENNTTLQDFSLIMLCDHSIISHVSSFGWWAAYLGHKEGKTIVAPRKYHPDRLDIDYREGFYPEGWTLV